VLCEHTGPGCRLEGLSAARTSYVTRNTVCMRCGGSGGLLVESVCRAVQEATRHVVTLHWQQALCGVV
jgi:hypothetical protein